MNKGLIGKKLGMTQIFDEDGRRIPVTVVEAGPCVVVQKKTVAKDGYNAIQVGFEQKDAARVYRVRCLATARLPVRELSASARTAHRRCRSVQGRRSDHADIFAAWGHYRCDRDQHRQGFSGCRETLGLQGGTFQSRFPLPSRTRLDRMFGNSFAGIQEQEDAGTTGEQDDYRAETAGGQGGCGDNLLLIKGAIPGSDNGLVLIKNSVKAK